MCCWAAKSITSCRGHASQPIGTAAGILKPAPPREPLLVTDSGSGIPQPKTRQSNTVPPNPSSLPPSFRVRFSSRSGRLLSQALTSSLSIFCPAGVSPREALHVSSCLAVCFLEDLDQHRKYGRHSLNHQFPFTISSDQEDVFTGEGAVSCCQAVQTTRLRGSPFALAVRKLTAKAGPRLKNQLISSDRDLSPLFLFRCACFTFS